MESGAGSQGDGHSCGLEYPSWNRRSLYLQCALMFVIFTTHFEWATSKRDETITVYPLANPWDKARLKAQGRCLNFHWENQSIYYYYWPEDDPDAHFEYCCALDGEQGNLERYTYGTYGQRLQLRYYYDLGLIDQCLPYWNCYHLFQTYFQTNLYRIYCEVTDLRNLYKRRFVVRTVLKHGLLQSAIPLIACLEILVIFFVALYWCVWRRPANGSRSIVKDASRAWFRHIRKTLLMDWTHLYLLAIIGNGLVEAVGRQTAYTSQSKSFYNYARLYVVLSILVWYSSVLQQVAYAIADIDLYHEAAAHEANGSSQATAEPNPAPSATLPPLSIPRHPPAISALEKILGLNDDWKWQPIAAQAGILFCLWGFLTYSSAKDDESTVGAVFGVVVSAACPWSGLYASKVIVRAFPWLLRRVYENFFNRRRNYRGLWRSVVHLQQWPGRRSRARHGVARPEDSAAFLELVENDVVHAV